MPDDRQIGGRAAAAPYTINKRDVMHLTLLGLQGASLGSLISWMEILTMANHLAQHAGKRWCFSWEVATPNGAPVSDLGVTIAADRSMDEVTDTDLVFTPAFIGSVQSALTGQEQVCSWLQGCHQRSIPIATSCTGSFLLAQAGLLDGRRAATNWLFAGAFRRLFPQVILDEDSLVVHDHGVYTTGATMALHHLLLSFVEREYGAEIARKLGGLLLIDPNRNSQAPYRHTLLRRPHGDREIAQVEEWLDRNWPQPAGTAAMAAVAGLGERQFLRRFKSATGRTPIEYLQQLRIEEARHLLETTNRTVSDITWSVGYEDLNTFRRLFQKKVGLTPGQYRQRFNRSQSAAGAGSRTG